MEKSTNPHVQIARNGHPTARTPPFFYRIVPGLHGDGPCRRSSCPCGEAKAARGTRPYGDDDFDTVLRHTAGSGGTHDALGAGPGASGRPCCFAHPVPVAAAPGRTVRVRAVVRRRLAGSRGGFRIAALRAQRGFVLGAGGPSRSAGGRRRAAVRAGQPAARPHAPVSSRLLAAAPCASSVVLACADALCRGPGR